MKLSEYAAEILKILAQETEKGNDPDVIMSVRDHYSAYGTDAEIDFKAEGTIWSGVKLNSDTNTLRLSCSLKSQMDHSTNELKQPKITFRKK